MKSAIKMAKVSVGYPGKNSHCLKITQNVAFEFWHFPSIFVLLKLTFLVTLFDDKHQVFKNSPKWTIFCTFNELLSTQNVNVARLARNIEWDFFCDFQTPCEIWSHFEFSREKVSSRIEFQITLLCMLPSKTVKQCHTRDTLRTRARWRYILSTECD